MKQEIETSDLLTNHSALSHYPLVTCISCLLPRSRKTYNHEHRKMALMASSRLTFFTNIGILPSLKPIRSSHTTVNLSPFTKKISLNVSSARSISGFAPILLNRVYTVASPSHKAQPLTIVSAKGYKMKTHKASAKRFRVTGSGKIMRRRAGKQHLLRKKNAKRRLRLSKMQQVNRGDYDNVIGALPYLKVNRLK